MNIALRTLGDYEYFIYSLVEQFPIIKQSTVTVVRSGATLARVAGELLLAGDFRIVVRERLVFDRLPGAIDWYGYEVWRGEEKLYWYDCQPHPHEPALQENHPHHKHIPPEMKHHRVTALNMRFDAPNLPEVIREIEKLLV